MNAKRVRRPYRARRRPAPPAPFPVHSPSPDVEKPRLWPWVLAALLLGLGLFLALHQRPSANVANNLPPGRKVADAPPPPPPALPPKADVPRRHPFSMAGRADSGPALASPPPQPTVWDRAKQSKVTFKILRGEGERAEAAIFRKPNKLVRRLVSDAGKAEVVRLVWDGNDESGNPVPAGSYFVRLSGAGGDAIREIEVK